MLPLYIELFLPDEYIFAILCWLPVLSLLRFRSVCKLWNFIIQDCKFINEHIRQSTGLWVRKTISTIPSAAPTEYVYMTSCTGLILEKGNFTIHYRLRNPFTRKVLDLPNPNENIYNSIRMCYIPSPSDVKLVYPYLNIGSSHICCKILTAGTDLTWRTIDLPFSSKPQNTNVQTILIDNIYYVMMLSNEQEMVCLEMENEQLSRIKIPKSFFLDWTRVWFVEWERKLTLACVEDDGVHLWSLENWREQKWVENKDVVSRTLFSKRFILFEDEGWLVDSDHALMAHLLMDALFGKELDRENQPAKQSFWYYFEPSLVHVKGMRRDGETNYKRTRIIREACLKFVQDLLMSR